MAMAMPPSDMMLALKPSRRNGMNAISTAIGIVTIGIERARHVPEEEQDDERHGQHDLDQRRAAALSIDRSISSDRS